MDAQAIAYKTANKTQRRIIQTLVVRGLYPKIKKLTRELVPSADRRNEGQQVAALGLLVALERFDPAKGVPFVDLAMRHAASEIKAWKRAGAS